MAEFKVFIPSAGTGSRVASINRQFNKAMLEINNKPVISHIIDKFQNDVPIVVALGYQGDILKQYLELAYPDRDIEFVTVSHYEGPESGLGVTLFCAHDLLQCRFIFISNDALVLDEIPNVNDNWIGYSERPAGNEYRSVVLEEGWVNDIAEKGEFSDGLTYIGVCGIKDYKAFWKEMELNYSESRVVGESQGIKDMLNNSAQHFSGIKFNWLDTGNKESYEQSKNLLQVNDYNILDKDGEAIWFVNNKVIKYSSDEKFISNRIKRVEHIQRWVPKILGSTKNMYSYEYIDGKTFSGTNSIQNFRFLIDYLKDFWGPQKWNEKEYFHSFYIDKTNARIQAYFDKFNNFDSNNEIINGKQYKSLFHYMGLVNVTKFDAPIMGRFHGDLHFENIIVGDNVPFVLIDWRQDFEGSLEKGDIYYDIAKLWHGMIVSHELILKNYFTFERDGNEINFSFLRKSQHIEYEKIFFMWLEYEGYDIQKVKILTALIFLNIAALHHYPYCHFLFYLGKTMLGDFLEAM